MTTASSGNEIAHKMALQALTELIQIIQSPKPRLQQETQWGTLTYSEDVVLLGMVCKVKAWLDQMIQQLDTDFSFTESDLQQLLDMIRTMENVAE